MIIQVWLRRWYIERYMMIELTNYCNIRCTVCPTGIGKLHRRPAGWRWSHRGHRKTRRAARPIGRSCTLRRHIDGGGLVDGIAVFRPGYYPWSRHLSTDIPMNTVVASWHRQSHFLVRGRFDSHSWAEWRYSDPNPTGRFYLSFHPIKRLGISIIDWNHASFSVSGFMPPTWDAGIVPCIFFKKNY